MLGGLTESSGPEAGAFTAETVDAIHAGGPVQAGAARTLVNVFCAVHTSPAGAALTAVTRHRLLRKEQVKPIKHVTDKAELAQ